MEAADRRHARCDGRFPSPARPSHARRRVRPCSGMNQRQIGGSAGERRPPAQSRLTVQRRHSPRRRARNVSMAGRSKPGSITDVPQLTPALTRTNAVAMVAGTIIGASIFVQPSEIARHLATPFDIMLVWLACGVLTLFGALVCAELASAFPQTGGLYVFLRETFSPLPASSGAGRCSGACTPASSPPSRRSSRGMRRISSTSATTGIRVDRRRRDRRALGAELLRRPRRQPRADRADHRQIARHRPIVVAGFSLLRPASISIFSRGRDRDPRSRRAQRFLLAMVAGLFAYGGWHMVTYTAGETVMPARTIPIALIAGVASSPPATSR